MSDFVDCQEINELNTYDAALEYKRHGWKVLPLLGKRPAFSDFIDRTYTRGEIRQGPNIGLIFGRRSLDLIDIDIDAIEALEIADLYLPWTGLEYGRPERPRSHRLYICPGATYAAFSDPFADKADKAMLVEIRGDTAAGAGRHSMCPPSLHPDTGERLYWHEFGQPAVIDAEKLRTSVAWLSAAALVRRYVDPWLDEPLSEGPTLEMIQRGMGPWPVMIEPLCRWLSIVNPLGDLMRPRPVRRFLTKTGIDLAALVVSIPNDLGYADWIKIGLAIFDAGGSAEYPIFLEFSRRSPRNHDATTAKTWAAIERHPPTRLNGVATLRWFAGGRRNG